MGPVIARRLYAKSSPCLRSLARHGPWGWVAGSGFQSCRRPGFTSQGHFDMDQMCPWTFWTGPNIKDLWAWTKCLSGHFGRDQMFCKERGGNGLKKGHSHPLAELQLRCTSPGPKALCPTSHCSPKAQFLEVLFSPWKV